MDLLANRKRLNGISGSFCIRPKCDKRKAGGLEAGATSCVNVVTRIDFLCKRIAFVVNKSK